LGLKARFWIGCIPVFFVAALSSFLFDCRYLYRYPAQINDAARNATLQWMPTEKPSSTRCLERTADFILHDPGVSIYKINSNILIHGAIVTIKSHPQLKDFVRKPVHMEGAPVHRPCSIAYEDRRRLLGFTLVEFVIVLAIMATLSAIAIPNYITYRYKAQVAAAIVEIRILEEKIANYAVDYDRLPESLNDMGAGPFIDPWGNAYAYLKIAGVDHPGGGKTDKRRKDHNMVPVNSDYDLYSKGEDGDSKAPFTAKHSRDDIVRANDGEFVGLASDY
jgi:general secretion pathway protein G